MAYCYARIWIPYDPEEDWGYYDLYINGTVTIKGRTLANPVFAYGHDSKLYIYPNSLTGSYYPINSWAGYYAYRYKFTCNSFSNFESRMSSAIASFDSSSNSSLVKCNIEQSNPFSTYSRQEINSFAAVATWCNWLGNSSLLTEYNNAHDNAYQKYLPATLLSNSSISNQWTAATMNGNSL